ncbi:hypothetical protein Sru01_20960 [Sphaerisporangium rufum]|uniref:Uncharacterized protein n=2 Tax=Sphaerisporangium rufum TaxID=1381558 RepID=A0A919UYT6_9ACTN|nr:hypothetical protein Sru01_20960 [Sphaerisporangium rufum]
MAMDDDQHPRPADRPAGTDSRAVEPRDRPGPPGHTARAGEDRARRRGPDGEPDGERWPDTGRASTPGAGPAGHPRPVDDPAGAGPAGPPADAPGAPDADEDRGDRDGPDGSDGPDGPGDPPGEGQEGGSGRSFLLGLAWWP